MIKNLSKLFNQLFRKSVKGTKNEDIKMRTNFVTIGDNKYQLEVKFYGLFSVDRQDKIKDFIYNSFLENIPMYRFSELIYSIDNDIKMEMTLDKAENTIIIEVYKIHEDIVVNDVKILADELSYDDVELVEEYVKKLVLEGRTIPDIQKNIEKTINADCNISLEDEVLIVSLVLETEYTK